jgi:outer membrane protein
MVRKKFFMALFLAAIVVTFAHSQKLWTLEECIEYAHKNNLQVQKQNLQVKMAESNFSYARANVLPTANAFANYTFNKGRAPNFDTYEYVDQAFEDGNVGIESRMSLFNGLSNYFTIRQSRYNLLARIEDVENLKDNITLSIGGAYLQILLNEELLKVAENQLEITRLQVEKIQRLTEVGNLSRGELYEIQAQEARETAAVVRAKNDLEVSYLALVQYMDLEPAEMIAFKIEEPELNMENAGYLRSVDSVYADALRELHMIKSAEYNLKSSEKGLAAQKGLIFPSLSLRYLYYTLYSEISLNPEDPVAQYRWMDQLQDKGYQQLSFSLNIPIFNNLYTTNRISTAKVNLLDSEVNLDITRQTLFKNIQKAFTDANAAFENYEANLETVRSMEEAYKYTEQKFNVGMVSSVDYNLAKTNLTNAQSDLLQAKYMYIFYSKILDFYSGLPITLYTSCNNS